MASSSAARCDGRRNSSRLVREPCIALCATLLRVDAVRAAGARLDDGLGGLAAWAFLRRLALHGRMVGVETAVCEHRLGEGDAPEWPYIPIDYHDPRLAEILAGPGAPAAARPSAWTGLRRRLRRG
jgi:hypothetical protein